MRALVVSCLVLAGCGSDTYLVVTVNARASVHDATKLEVTQINAGTTKISNLDLGGHAFPVTFSISAPGHSGQLDLAIKAITADGLLAGLGSGSTTLESTDATVQLDPADFVVNTDVADDQFLTTDFETVGFQLASTTDGNWTVGFGSKCTECNLYARRFDVNGVAVKTAAAAGTNAFPVTTVTTQPSQSFPAIASAGTSTIEVWDFFDVSDSGTGVACRTIDPMGALSPGQLSITAMTEVADTVSATALSNGNYAVTWQLTAPNQIRSIIVLPDCTTLSVNPVTVSTTAGTTGPHRAQVANNGPAVLYAWITDDAIHIKTATTALSGLSAESVLVSPPVGFLIEEVRVAPMGAGFAVAARLTATNRTSPGSILLYRVSAAGALVAGPPTLVTDKSGSDFSNGRVGFGIATRSDGATMIVWHQCDDGTGGVCDGRLDVYGRVVRPTGVPVGDPFEVPTSTVGNQINPSVVAIPSAFAVSWNDASKTDPDPDGTAVRARIVYPPFDEAASILGAACGASLPPCGTGLACAMGSDNAMRCYESCTPPMCPHGGSCSPASGGGSACTF